MAERLVENSLVRAQKKQTEMRGSLSRASLSASIRTVEGEERTVELSFSSEEPYSRWWGMEVLDHTKGCVDLDRINNIGCVLYNHKRDVVIGKILKAWDQDNRCYAKIQFDEDTESDIIYKKVQSGTLKGVSVGYTVDSWEEVMPGKKSADGRFIGPCEIAKKWTPFEISVVSVPADPTVGIGREMDSCTDAINSGRTLDFFCRQIQINQNKYESRRQEN